MDSQIPSEVQAKSVGEIVFNWNHELQKRTSAFVLRTDIFAEWDNCILNNRNHLLNLQANLGKASTSQERMERQLQILLANQIEISDALTFLESEVDHLESAQQKNKVVHPSLFPSQSLIYSLADKISVHLCNLGETFLAIYPLPRDRKENDAPGSDVKGTIIPLTHEILINHLQALNLVEKRLGRNVIG
ncbi:structural constituent of nuclear pore, nucleoporin 62 [Micromonas pusilla CCMP1545]|uniref:Structural constituent of nuclear pore, nucleoporin 62 n=1 Tax=Micromonas pusilla (strain CCMP1545) TaxID=564608 RepID=C1MLP9_MICPC|nr:structural constituent of nuclear pore, nucleoporin 62 [Micromonas pusilla CCMP1545]EEH59982.1 structural constituent of nuclear pore, nucleoporin 62 [Micromonas pusilla CCMP1545]|mmetsp:Transcript_9583/g.34905  ORF Transcript_9583/g.34905 Transcript_9583/m.34905 type:complete len:190 (-) Transcript_9583:202-771(-)|eukprot:XP_003056606.1 structural constituent of nuclear pore, nucleoporin 62 [Micromonas pusilla CCMP1545]